MGEAQVTSAGSILHRRVKNRHGEDLGQIEELVIDLDRGFIAYAVLAFAGVIGRSRHKLFVVPWGAFSVDPSDRAFVLDVQQDTLENAAGVDDREPVLSGSSAAATGQGWPAVSARR